MARCRALAVEHAGRLVKLLSEPLSKRQDAHRKGHAKAVEHVKHLADLLSERQEAHRNGHVEAVEHVKHLAELLSERQEAHRNGHVETKDTRFAVLLQPVQLTA